MIKQKPIRIILAKPGLDGHDRGAKVVAKALKDAGMEVIYTGLRQTEEAILQAAIEEDADLIGLSILSGSHIPICQDLLELMKKKKIKDIPIVLGGTIPQKDVQKLKDMGVKEVFRSSMSFEEIAGTIKKIVAEKK